MPQHFSDRFWNTKSSDQKPFRGKACFRYLSYSKTRICIYTLEHHADSFAAIYNSFEADNPDIDLRARPTRAQEDREHVEQLLADRPLHPQDVTVPNPDIPVNGWHECQPLVRAPLNETPEMRRRREQADLAGSDTQEVDLRYV